LSGIQGVTIARRSLSLAKTYPVIAIGLTVVGLALGASGISAGTTSIGSVASGRGASAGLPFLAVPLQALAAMLFATPVVLLFVYDKNNGVLEYLLSLGMSQRDIYRQYLKAALLLAGAIGVLDVIVDLAVGMASGTGSVLFLVPLLAVILGLSVVSLVTVVMMSFSSLQKQRVGSNQPLGMSVGAFLVLPTYLIPFILSSIAFWVDLFWAAIILGISLVMFVVSSRLISREKLLP
jgi:hypothetical protein